jgi:hypothetical protein
VSRQDQQEIRRYRRHRSRSNSTNNETTGDETVTVFATMTVCARRWLRRIRRDEGMATAEYAVGTIAACALALVLWKVVTGGTVFDQIESLITRALHAPA